MRWLAFLTALSAVGCSTSRPAIDFDTVSVVDLTHAFNEDTIYWPNSPSTFELQSLSYGVTPAGFFYASNAICTPEHGGTHLDAPIHFFADRQTTDEIPLDRLMGPAVVIDARAECQADRDYRLTVEKVLEFEAVHGQIPAASIVILRTGWSQYWPQRKPYLGDDTPGDTSNLSFPSFGPEAARLLVEDRLVAVLGVDTASIDYGRSTEFMVHRIASEHNVPGLENLTRLFELPPTGATIIALPMKIEGGSGGPARVVALLPR